MLGLCVVVLLAWTATVKACPDFDECAANRAPGLDFNSISPSNVAKFCTAARHGIGSCLTHNVSVKGREEWEKQFGGSSYSRGLALKQCAENATGADRERIGRIARLYFFACVYNDIRDATKKECFEWATARDFSSTQLPNEQLRGHEEARRQVLLPDIVSPRTEGDEVVEGS